MQPRYDRIECSAGWAGHVTSISGGLLFLIWMLNLLLIRVKGENLEKMNLTLIMH